MVKISYNSGKSCSFDTQNIVKCAQAKSQRAKEWVPLTVWGIIADTGVRGWKSSNKHAFFSI